MNSIDMPSLYLSSIIAIIAIANAASGTSRPSVPHTADPIGGLRKLLFPAFVLTAVVGALLHWNGTGQTVKNTWERGNSKIEPSTTTTLEMAESNKGLPAKAKKATMNTWTPDSTATDSLTDFNWDLSKCNLSETLGGLGNLQASTKQSQEAAEQIKGKLKLPAGAGGQFCVTALQKRRPR